MLVFGSTKLINIFTILHYFGHIYAYQFKWNIIIWNCFRQVAQNVRKKTLKSCTLFRSSLKPIEIPFSYRLPQSHTTYNYSIVAIQCCKMPLKKMVNRHCVPEHILYVELMLHTRSLWILQIHTSYCNRVEYCSATNKYIRFLIDLVCFWTILNVWAVWFQLYTGYFDSRSKTMFK